MIYVKRVTSADITRQIDLTKETATFFGFSDFSGASEIQLLFEEETTGRQVNGTIKKSGHTVTIIGGIFSEVKSRCKLDDIVVFSTTRTAGKYKFLIVSKFNKLYSQFESALVLFGSHSGVLNKTTHLVAAFDTISEDIKHSNFRPYITAIKSKPFLLLAGISGTGKSRIVRELARACWDEGSEEYKAHKPKNFEMVQVKPNWHDSSELLGYVSRIDGERFVVGPFLKFMVKAINDPEHPYFLCLDEMNLAPVEQYFAEYLSVVESRKVNEEGKVVTDPIIDYEPTDAYFSLINQLFTSKEEREQYLTEEDGKRLTIPQNLIVIGTVNMDETTFSFSRKVLDRAMTIEMNEVDLEGGLEKRHEQIGKLGIAELVGSAVEGVDVYAAHKDVCDKVIAYLKVVNVKLEGTPFKIAFRTRNEFLLYVVNNLPYNKDEDGEDLDQNFIIARALDEITNMKILSRIEGDETKVSEQFLKGLSEAVKEQLEAVCSDLFNKDDAAQEYQSISLAKLDEMTKKLASGYTSFWS